MTDFDLITNYLCNVYIGKDTSYAVNNLSEDYLCHCSSGTKNKAETIALIKKYIKKHPVYSITYSVESKDEDKIALCVYFQCREKEKFLGFTFGENDRIYKHIRSFKVKNGMITESWEELAEEEY